MSSKQQDNKSQSDKFIKKARELGADEEEAAFDDKLRRLTKAKPQPKKEKTPD
mgnify:CR=1 FL=1|jgi:hypothetical protein